ncbi:MAG: TolB family protein [Bacteroidota bacterium]
MKKLLSILAMIVLITSCGEDSSGPSPSDNTDWYYFFAQIESLDKYVSFKVNENGDVKLFKENTGVFAVHSDKVYYLNDNDDGNKYFAYSDRAGRNEVILMNDIAGRFNGIALSPDGKTLVYNIDGVTYLMDIESRLENQIDFDGGGFSFSQNSDKIVTIDLFDGENFVLKVYDLASDSSKVLLTLEPNTECDKPCWSESGEAIIFHYIDEDDADLPGKLIKIDVSDGSNEIIYEFTGDEVEYGWAGDAFYYDNGSKIFWYNYVSKKLITMNSDGSGVKKTTFPYEHCWINSDPFYSSNEIFLLTGSTEADAKVHIYNLDTGESRVLANDVITKLIKQMQ